MSTRFVRCERFQWVAFLSMLVGGAGLIYALLAWAGYHAVMTPFTVAVWITLTAVSAYYRQEDAKH